VADVEIAVGVGQGGSDEKLARHGQLRAWGNGAGQCAKGFDFRRQPVTRLLLAKEGVNRCHLRETLSLSCFQSTARLSASQNLKGTFRGSI
jgi:uncharacterized spore protein YtfJ